MASDIIDRQVGLQKTPSYMSVLPAAEQRQPQLGGGEGDPLSAISGRYVDNTVPAFSREEEAQPESPDSDPPAEEAQEPAEEAASEEQPSDQSEAESAASKMMERLGFKQPTEEVEEEVVKEIH